MGLTPSKCQDEEWLREKAAFEKPLETREEMLNRFQAIMLQSADTAQSARRQKIFRKFATWPGRWSVSDLSRVLSICSPEPLAQLVQDAGPTLYRLLLCTGAFPYHQTPPKELDLTTLIIGSRMLLDYESFLQASDRQNHDEDHRTRREIDYIWLLFQCLASSPILHRYEVENDNTKDIAQALRIISTHSKLRDPSNPKVIIWAAPLPSPETFSCARSQSPNEYLPDANLRAFGRLILSCQLQKWGCSPEQLLADEGGNFDSTANNVLAAFDLDESGNCTWPNFLKGARQIMPGVRIALNTVLSPLIYNLRDIDLDHLDSQPLDQAIETLRCARAEFVSDCQSPGDILNHMLMAQLTMFLPESFQLDDLLLSSLERQPLAEHLKANVTQRNRARLILVSGSTEGTRSNVVCGIYLPSDDPMDEEEGESAIIFQSQPQYRVFRGKIDNAKSSLAADLPDKIDSAFRIRIGSTAYAEARMDTQAGSSFFEFSTDDDKTLCKLFKTKVEILQERPLPHAANVSTKDDTNER